MIADDRDIVSRRPMYTRIAAGRKQYEPDELVLSRRSAIFERVVLRDGSSALRCIHCHKRFDYAKQSSGHYASVHSAKLGSRSGQKEVLEAVAASLLEPVRPEKRRARAASNGSTAYVQPTLDDSALLAQLRQMLAVPESPEVEPLRARVAELESELARMRGVLKALADLSRE